MALPGAAEAAPVDRPTTFGEQLVLSSHRAASAAAEAAVPEVLMTFCDGPTIAATQMPSPTPADSSGILRSDRSSLRRIKRDFRYVSRLEILLEGCH